MQSAICCLSQTTKICHSDGGFTLNPAVALIHDDQFDWPLGLNEAAYGLSAFFTQITADFI